ncbi:MAG: hypothetical protein KatS3mg111_0915 [Pirellulaceae bacterium]|nr:MAG: hypothetical protein KatS3mg111_0915 [Pirellulaceae bacterium]
MLLGEMGWDYQSLRDAWFQRSANWNALFDPSTGQFDESFAVSGDDEVHLSGYEYHPTNTNLWKTPLEEALEELFPLDYLDTTGDPPSSTDPSAGDQFEESSDRGDTTWGSYTGSHDNGSDEAVGDGSTSTSRWWNPFTWFDWGIDWSEAVDEELAIVRQLNQTFGTTHTRLDKFTAEERARIEQALGQKFNWEAASAIRASEQALRARDKVLRSSEVSFVVAGVADALAGGLAICEAATGVVASWGGYLSPGVGGAARGQVFKHAWIKHDLYNKLRGLVGKADFNKFLAALKKGVVGPMGESGIKILANPVGKYTHELKIGGSAQRLLGYIDENGVLIFDKFVRGGLH